MSASNSQMAHQKKKKKAVHLYVHMFIEGMQVWQNGKN